MSATNDGGPAFPFGQISEHSGQPINGFFNPGMTLRDYFAAAALQGILFIGGGASWDDDAKNAYKAADAMLKAREAK